MATEVTKTLDNKAILAFSRIRTHVISKANERESIGFVTRLKWSTSCYNYTWSPPGKPYTYDKLYVCMPEHNPRCILIESDSRFFIVELLKLNMSIGAIQQRCIEIRKEG